MTHKVCVKPLCLLSQTGKTITDNNLADRLGPEYVLQYDMFALALPTAPPMLHWYANSCPAMTLHMQASVDLPAWGTFKL